MERRTFAWTWVLFAGCAGAPTHTPTSHATDAAATASASVAAAAPAPDASSGDGRLLVGAPAIEDPQLSPEDALSEARRLGILGDPPDGSGAFAASPGVGGFATGPSGATTGGLGGPNGGDPIEGPGGPRPAGGLPAHELRVGRLTVTGPLPLEEIERRVRMRVAQFRFCYARELVARPTIAGTVELALVVATSGAVSRVSIARSSLADDAVEACLDERVRTLKFPEATATTTVTLPLSFRPAPAP